MTTCPNCGSRFLRPSKPRTKSERRGRLRFVDPLRCLDCKTRFVANTFVLGDLRYTRCPGCHRMDLNSWTGKSYIPSFWSSLKIIFGANRYRCEYCRLNYASFRPRKEIFSFRRWAKLNLAHNEAQNEQVDLAERAGD